MTEHIDSHGRQAAPESAFDALPAGGSAPAGMFPAPAGGPAPGTPAVPAPDAPRTAAGASGSAVPDPVVTAARRERAGAAARGRTGSVPGQDGPDLPDDRPAPVRAVDTEAADGTYGPGHRDRTEGAAARRPYAPASGTGDTHAEHPAARHAPGPDDHDPAAGTDAPRTGQPNPEAARRPSGPDDRNPADSHVPGQPGRDRPVGPAGRAPVRSAGPGGHGPAPHVPEQPGPGAHPEPVGPAHTENGTAVPRAGAAGASGGERLRFVGAATRRIARGIDLDEIVLGLCRATVPTFADAILVYLRDPLPVGDERPVGPVVLRLRRTDQLPEHVRGLYEPANAAADTAAPADRSDPAADLAALAAERCEVRIGGPLAEVLRGVRPVFGDSSAARAALPELLGEGRCVPERQRTILAPLRGRRRVIGAAVFIRRADRPAFEGDDLLVAAQLATHTALGVDKAVLYGREVYIADELQRTMLPDSLPQPTGVRLASRYLPAAETARVGGDWYDAIPLPGNRIALVVGDVMGHSMTSAAIMGQLRTTAQTLAGLDLPPSEVLHHLDEQAQRLGSDRMATCLYAVYDPVAHRIVIANAGHPPPVMLHRGGRAEVLRVPPGAPIGVGGVDFEAVELDAPAGATLLLYTDGLVESRIRDVWTGIEQLRERLTETARLTGPNPPPLEPLCDEVLGMLGPGDRDDDIALLAARFEGIAPSDVAYWFLDPRPQTARQARRLARRALARWGLEELTDGVELLVSEVITNAVRYAERPITLRLLRTDVLRCEVGDDVPQLPRLRQARPSDEGGRGLYLVNRLARRWGATRLSTGKVVWFELALPAHAR
ncbi:SpoIIE family protein phosphatase [Streptomyces gamaensis]|uniref:SpoIIE family protein phosphatase n=1 Tax=Streptomyces gamaensis TaxID=1763542 RepID=A0ABW0YRT9_9ACTN